VRVYEAVLPQKADVALDEQRSECAWHYCGADADRPCPATTKRSSDARAS